MRATASRSRVRTTLKRALLDLLIAPYRLPSHLSMSASTVAMALTRPLLLSPSGASQTKTTPQISGLVPKWGLWPRRKSLAAGSEGLGCGGGVFGLEKMEGNGTSCQKDWTANAEIAEQINVT